MKMAGRVAIGLLAAVIAAVGGCQTYREKPLNDTTVAGATTEPTNQQMQAQSREIKHPILKPIELHPDQGLSPDEAAIIAVLINPSLRAQRDERASADAELIKAGILPNPTLSYNYDFVTGGDTRGTVNAYGLGLTWEVTSLISHETKVNAAKSAVAAVNLDIAWQEWQTAEAAKMAVYDLLALQQQLEIAQDVDRRLQENLDLIRHAEDAGLKTAVELAAAEAAARDVHATVLQTTRDIEHQRLQLNRAIGVAPDVQLQLRAGTPLPSRFDAPNRDELLTDLEQRRLDLLGLKRGYDSQEQTLRAAVLDQFPKISLGFNHGSDTTDVHTTGPGISIDLPIFDRNQGTIAAETATRQKLFDEYHARVFEARSDVASALVDIKSINAQITDAEAAVPNLQHLVDVYRDAVDHGAADVLSYYEAWNNLASRKLDILKLKQQLADNRIALELAAGRYFADESTPSTRPAAAAALTPSSGTPGEGRGEGRGEGDFRAPIAFETRNHPHPNPLPSYRARGPEQAAGVNP
jgi:outer membrane protein, heavy metal efflux system